jgi:hypothetical protein
MHGSIEKHLGYPADFRVSYRFYTAEEGGRSEMPFQGYRSDFWYEHPDIAKPEADSPTLFMIWPEFEDADGRVISDNTKPVDRSGTAKMWVAVSKSRAYHIGKIEVGVRGYFMEGPNRVAECTVIEILRLATNS